MNDYKAFVVFNFQFNIHDTALATEASGSAKNSHRSFSQRAKVFKIGGGANNKLRKRRNAAKPGTARKTNQGQKLRNDNDNGVECSTNLSLSFL